MGQDDQSDDEGNTEEDHADDIDGVRTEKVSVFVGEECVAMRAALFQRGPILEDPISTAIGAASPQSTPGGGQEASAARRWEIDAALWRLRRRHDPVWSLVHEGNASPSYLANGTAPSHCEYEFRRRPASLVLQCSGGNVADEVAAAENEDDDQGNGREQRTRHHHRVIGLVDAVELRQGHLQGDPVRIDEDHEWPEVIVPRSNEGEDAEKGQGRSQEWQCDVAIELPPMS